MRTVLSLYLKFDGSLPDSNPLTVCHRYGWAVMSKFTVDMMTATLGCM